MTHLSRKIAFSLYFFAIVQTTIGCNSWVIVNSSKEKKEKASTKNDEPPTSTGTVSAHTISTNVSLVSSDVGTASLPTITGPYTAVSAIVAPLAPPAVTGPFATTNSLWTPAAAVAPATSLLTANAAPTLRSVYNTYDATITANATYSSEVTADKKSCDVDSPFSSIVCAIGNFTFSSSAFKTSTLSTVAYVAGAKAATKVASSNSLEVTKFKIKQLMNTVTAGDDGVAGISGNFVYFNDRIYFSANNSAGFRKLYSSNGSDLVQVSNTYPAGGDGLFAAVVLNGSLYFSAYISALNYKLFSFDGTTITQLTDTVVGGNDHVLNFNSCGNFIYFDGYNAAGFNRLHSVQGTTVRQLSNFSGAADDNTNLSSSKCAMNQIFIPHTVAGGLGKLVTSDGTSFLQISNINVGNSDLSFSFLAPAYTRSAVFNGRLYFEAYSAVAGAQRKVFSTNGADIVKHTDFSPGSHDFPQPFLPCGNNLAITVYTNGFPKAYVFDGTTATQVSDFVSGASDNPYFYCLKDKLYMRAYDSGTNSKFYKIESGQATKISDIRPGSDDNLSAVSVGTDYMFLQMKDASGLFRLYSFDGTTMRQLSNINALGDSTLGIVTTNSASNIQVSPMNGRYWFWITETGFTKYKLFSSNGTDLLQMADLNPGASDRAATTPYSSFEKSGFLFLNMRNTVGDKMYAVCADSTSGC